MPVAGNLVIRKWTVLDGAGNPLTGQLVPTHVQLTLLRQSGSVLIAAAEVMTWTEIGATGRYSITFTPANSGYYSIELREVGAATQLRQFDFPLDILPAGAIFTPSLQNAYCSQSDIERWAQLAFSATSTPTDGQVAAFAEERASELTGIMSANGFTVTPSTVVAGTVEEDMLRATNAIGAASDCILSRFMQFEPSRTEKAAALAEEYQRRVDRLIAYVKMFLDQGYLTTPFVTGEMSEADEATIQDAGLKIGISMDQRF